MYIAGMNFTNTYATLAEGKGFGLGDIGTDHVGKTWVFVQATAAINQNDLVVYDETYKTVVAPVTTTNGLRGRNVGVAPVAFAVGEFGFVQVKGPTTLNVLASALANTRLNTTATAGSPDDDATTGAKELHGVALTANRAASNGPAPANLNWPTVGPTL